MQPFANTTNNFETSGVAEQSISVMNVEDLSKNLDDRINKIKQKYYERSSGNTMYDDKMLDLGKVDRRSYGLDYSRNARGYEGREGLKSSVFGYQSRPSTYHYASYL